MANFRFFKMAAVRHVGFLKLQFWIFSGINSDNARHRATFRENRPNGCGDIAILPFSVRHFGFVVRVFGPPTKSTWWSLSLCKKLLESMHWFREYAGFYRATAYNATHGIAVAILSVCLSVRLSVRCVYCEKTKQRTANILIPHETAITLVFWHQHWLVGDAPFPVKSALKVTHPLRKTSTSTDFRS